MSSREFYQDCLKTVLEIGQKEKEPRLIEFSLKSLSRFSPLVDHVNLEVLNVSCTQPFFDLIRMGKNPLMLSMANAKTPGGGVKNGSLAQEEFLCYISNLYRGLKKAEKEGLYPLEKPFILDRVSFFKTKPSPKFADGFNFPLVGSVISCAALKLEKGRKFTDEEYRETRKRIKNMLLMAISSGYRYIILSALGCGVFHNDPKEVASIFSYYLYQKKYGLYFRKVIFAILEDSRSTNSNSNFKTFSSILSK